MESRFKKIINIKSYQKLEFLKEFSAEAYISHFNNEAYIVSSITSKAILIDEKVEILSQVDFNSNLIICLVVLEICYHCFCANKESGQLNIYLDLYVKVSSETKNIYFQNWQNFAKVHHSLRDIKWNLHRFLQKTSHCENKQTKVIVACMFHPS